jgi:hypothetical protein
MRRAMRRRPMKRVGLISKYSPKESNVWDLHAGGLSEAAVDECCKQASSISCLRLYAGALRRGIERPHRFFSNWRVQGWG